MKTYTKRQLKGCFFGVGILIFIILAFKDIMMIRTVGYESTTGTVYSVTSERIDRTLRDGGGSKNFYKAQYSFTVDDNMYSGVIKTRVKDGSSIEVLYDKNNPEHNISYTERNGRVVKLCILTAVFLVWILIGVPKISDMAYDVFKELKAEEKNGVRDEDE